MHMIETLTRHKLILIVTAVVVAGVAWYGLSGTSAKTPDLVTTTTGSKNAAGQVLVSTLLALRAVKLDGTIFSDPSFMSLKDLSIEIVPEPVGRENPFAPLSRQSAPSANSTQSAQIFTPRR